MSVGSVLDGAAGPGTRHASGGLDDLRLFDASGAEVPFLVIAPPPVERDWVGGQLLPVTPTRASSGVEVDLGRAPASIGCGSRACRRRSSSARA